MRLTRSSRLRAAISAFAGLAALVSIATSTPYSPASGAERFVRDVAGAEYSTPLPAVRQLAAAGQILARPHEHSAGPLAFDAPRGVASTIVRAGRVHASPSAAVRGPMRARRLTFRYDATAPPAVL